MTKLFNPNDGLHGRQGGPFLDQVQQRQQEETRAIREGREPDYDNMQPAVGMELRTEEQLLQEAIHSATPPELVNFKGITADPVIEIPDDEVNEPDEDGDFVADEDNEDGKGTDPADPRDPNAPPVTNDPVTDPDVNESPDEDEFKAPSL